MQDVKNQQNVEEFKQKDVKFGAGVFCVKTASHTLVKSVLQAQDLKSKFDKQSVNLLSKCIDSSAKLKGGDQGHIKPLHVNNVTSGHKLSDVENNKQTAEQASSDPFSCGLSKNQNNVSNKHQFSDDGDFIEIPESPEHSESNSNIVQRPGNHQPSVKNIFYSTGLSERKPCSSDSLVNKPSLSVVYKDTTTKSQSQLTINGLKHNIFNSNSSSSSSSSSISNNSNRGSGMVFKKDNFAACTKSTTSVTKPMPSLSSLSLARKEASSYNNSAKQSQQPAITKFITFSSGNNNSNSNNNKNNENLSTVQDGSTCSVVRNIDGQERTSGKISISGCGSVSVFQRKVPSKQLMELMKLPAYSNCLLNKGSIMSKSLLKAGEEIYDSSSTVNGPLSDTPVSKDLIKPTPVIKEKLVTSTLVLEKEKPSTGFPVQVTRTPATPNYYPVFNHEQPVSKSSSSTSVFQGILPEIDDSDFNDDNTSTVPHSLVSSADDDTNAEFPPDDNDFIEIPDSPPPPQHRQLPQSHTMSCTEHKDSSKDSSSNWPLQNSFDQNQTACGSSPYFQKLTTVEIEDDSQEFNRLNYPHYKEMVKVFHEQFGLRRFRLKQLPAINAALLGHDCFILMPTGGGKSICYQLPALLSQGITVIISPLRSLILDQVNKLHSLDIPAACLTGDMSLKEADSVYKDLYTNTEPVLKLLFVTPEKVMGSRQFSDLLLSLYRRQMLARFVIDEAHCVSQWGHDFRPDYKRLTCLKQQYPDVPMMALTATATIRVRKDILHQLGMKKTKWFVSSFDRPNLKYQVLPKGNKATVLKDIIDLIKGKFPNKCGIVYCFSRNECDMVADELKRARILSRSYHAGLSDKQRTEVQTSWTKDRIKVVCATIAFGMGIDKPDVRFVIHFSVAKSVEGYYQEAGRAGRDGEPATCVLYYSYGDVQRVRKLIEKDQDGTAETKKTHISNLYRMVDYCENKSDCRRAIQLQYFGEKYMHRCPPNRATACDNCLSQESYKSQDVTEICHKLVCAVKQICSSYNSLHYTLNHFVDIMQGSKNKKVLSHGHEKMSIHGLCRDWQRVDIVRLVHKLVMENYLQEYLVTTRDDIVNSYIKIGPKANAILMQNTKIMFQTKEVKKASTSSPASGSVSVTSDNSDLESIQEKCFTELREAVAAIAEINCVNASSVMNIQTLRGMSRKLPETEAEMLTVIGVTRANYEKYGNSLLQITQKFAEEKNKLRTEVVEKPDSISRKRPAPSSFRGQRKATKKRKTTHTNNSTNYKPQWQSKYRGTGKNKNTKKGYNNRPSNTGPQTLQSSRNLPPSNRPGFLSAPKVSSVYR